VSKEAAAYNGFSRFMEDFKEAVRNEDRDAILPLMASKVQLQNISDNYLPKEEAVKKIDFKLFNRLLQKGYDIHNLGTRMDGFSPPYKLGILKYRLYFAIFLDKKMRKQQKLDKGWRFRLLVIDHRADKADK